MQTLYVVQAHYEKVEQTYAQAEKIYQQTHNTLPPPFAGINLAGARLFKGHIMEARDLFEKIVAVRDDKHILNLQASQGQNYLVHGLAWSAHALWCLGYPQQALNRTRAAIEFTQEFSQPFNYALSITYMAMLQEWCAEPVIFRSYAEDAYAFASSHKFIYYQAWANILVCFAQARQQNDSKCVGKLQDAIRAFTETGARARLPVYYSLLARACRLTKQVDFGLEAIEQGLSESLKNSEDWWDAELHRLRGELMLVAGSRCRRG